MYNHAPKDYTCPFCLIVKGVENEHVLTKQDDIVYKCDGVSSRQHNEPCGDQDVWHYHLHIFPRYKDDNLYLTSRELSKPEERSAYAEKLRNYFNQKTKK